MDVPMEMQHQAMGYDRAATMFSPDGHLLQVEYAEKTVRLGSASIGLACKDGVLIISDKRIRDKLIAPESASKVFEVDEHVMLTSAGILSDARILTDNAQVLAQQNRVTYDSPIEPISVIRMLADKKQMATQYGGLRPFAVAFMLGGVSKGKVHLYASDVTGNYYAYKANAIGEDDEKVKEILRADFDENMSVEEGLKFAMKVFKKTFGKNFEPERFDGAYIKVDNPKIVRLSSEDFIKYSK